MSVSRLEMAGTDLITSSPRPFGKALSPTCGQIANTPSHLQLSNASATCNDTFPQIPRVSAPPHQLSQPHSPALAQLFDAQQGPKRRTSQLALWHPSLLPPFSIRSSCALAFLDRPPHTRVIHQDRLCANISKAATAYLASALHSTNPCFPHILGQETLALLPLCDSILHTCP